jgi:predicted dithiol-disulfide oxidoreductase (DUF899 family)
MCTSMLSAFDCEMPDILQRRGAPDPMPIWTLLDMTPEGRGETWYPSLEYPRD